MYLCTLYFLNTHLLETYQTHLLDNGLRIIHLPLKSALAYCGVIVNAGSRDEAATEHGMAHFIEHMLFKGTRKRRSVQIINRLEDVGGELNAYTSKEETVVYAGFLKEYTPRAIELIADLVQNSTFPDKEAEKELLVIQEEIQSYNDSPSELIFDDFEAMIFDGNAIGHSVLGEEHDLNGFTPDMAKRFFGRYYQPGNMVFFYVGDIDFNKLINRVRDSFIFSNDHALNHERIAPQHVVSGKRIVNRDTHQVHCMIGTRAYDIHHPDRMALYLLNNILGGPGMNSRLNLALREKNGLVYTVESIIQPYTDCGWWAVYFGADPENFKKCERLVRKELLKLCDERVSEQKLMKYKTQIKGQMAISGDNKENLALALGKSYLRYGKFDSNEQVQEEIMNVSAEKLQLLAQELFAPEKLSVLIYQ